MLQSNLKAWKTSSLHAISRIRNTIYPFYQRHQPRQHVPNRFLLFCAFKSLFYSVVLNLDAGRVMMRVFSLIAIFVWHIKIKILLQFLYDKISQQINNFHVEKNGWKICCWPFFHIFLFSSSAWKHKHLVYSAHTYVETSS